VELKKTVKDTGIVFQLGHENRQQMSFKIAGELYRKKVLGNVSMVQTYTNRNGLFGAWIRNKIFSEQATLKTVNWKEFLGGTPWQEFDPKRYFNWQRYSEYGTSVTGNDFSHHFDCVNQVLNLGIPESVVAQGGQFYYKNHGDMPDILNAAFLYPKKGITLTYDATLINSNYRESYIMGSEASMGIDRGLTLYKDPSSEKYKKINTDSSDPLYVYAPGSDVDAVSSATSQAYIKGGYGSTYIDGKVIDATFLHVKEWIDAIRNQGNTSCNIDVGFEEAVTFNMANLAYQHKKTVVWDPINEKAILA
jgi:predicted dehydrogenase